MYDWADTASNAHGYTYIDSHAYAQRNRPSHCNTDADRLPGCMREPDPVSHSDTNSHTNVDTNAKPDTDAFTESGPGVEYFDAAAG